MLVFIGCKMVVLQDLARFWKKSYKTMYGLARFCHNLARSCKTTIRIRLGINYLLTYLSRIEEGRLLMMFRKLTVDPAVRDFRGEVLRIRENTTHEKVNLD